MKIRYKLCFKDVRNLLCGQFLILSCVICLAACGSKGVSESSGDSSATEPDAVESTESVETESTAVNTVPAETTAVKVTSQIVTYPKNQDYIPENAVYKRNHYVYMQGEKTLVNSAFYDEHDNELRSINLRTNEYSDYCNVYDDCNNLISRQQTRYSSDKDEYYVSRDEYEYDNNNRLRRVDYYNDSINLRYYKTYEYNGDGLPISEASYYPGQKNPKDLTVSEYDENGNVKLDKIYCNGNNKPYEYIEYEYDENGRKTTEFYKDTDGYSNTIAYSYDDRGNVITIDREHGEFYNITTYTYDEKNRCTSTQHSRKDGTVVSKIEYEYEEISGNLTEIPTETVTTAVSGSDVVYDGCGKGYNVNSDDIVTPEKAAYSVKCRTYGDDIPESLSIEYYDEHDNLLAGYHSYDISDSKGIVYYNCGYSYEYNDDGTIAVRYDETVMPKPEKTAKAVYENDDEGRPSVITYYNNDGIKYCQDLYYYARPEYSEPYKLITILFKKDGVERWGTQDHIYKNTYNYDNKLISKEDELGVIEYYKYDENGNISFSSREQTYSAYGGSYTAHSNEKNTSYYEYDSRNRLIKKVNYFDGELDSTEEYEYTEY